MTTTEPKSDPVGFDSREPDGWINTVAGFPQSAIDDDKVLLLKGDCPRCLDYMDVAIPLKEKTGTLKTMMEADTPQTIGEPFEMVVRCNCRAEHKGRPEGTDGGCGAFGKLRVGGT